MSAVGYVAAVVCLIGAALALWRPRPSYRYEIAALYFCAALLLLLLTGGAS